MNAKEARERSDQSNDITDIIMLSAAVQYAKDRIARHTDEGKYKCTIYSSSYGLPVGQLDAVAETLRGEGYKVRRPWFLATFPRLEVSW